MAFEQPEYPKILLVTDWNKKKSIIAKLAGKTGIGDYLRRTKKAFDDAANHWHAFDASLCRNLGHLDTTLYAVKHHTRPIKEIEDACSALSSHCRSTLQTWKKKKKLIPKETVKHVEKMQAAAQALKREVDVKELVKTLKADCDALRKQFEADYYREMRHFSLALMKATNAVKSLNTNSHKPFVEFIDGPLSDLRDNFDKACSVLPGLQVHESRLVWLANWEYRGGYPDEYKKKFAESVKLLGEIKKTVKKNG